jgi:hypothetical protein
MSYGAPTRFCTGRPQWQIEAVRRLEIPEDMQTKYGFAPLGGPDSAIKQLIFGGNAARMYRINLKAADNIRLPTFSEDRLAALKSTNSPPKGPRICVTATSGPPNRGLGF